MPIQMKSKKQDEPAASGKAAVTAKKGKAPVRGRLPNKQSINLAMIGVKRTRWGLLVLVLVLIVLAAGAIGKFLILDRLSQVSAAEAEAEDVRRQIDLYNAKIKSYGDLSEVYAHYTFAGMTEEERTRVMRTDVMDLLQRTVLLRTEVSRWELKGNVLTMTVQGDTLEDVNKTAQTLLDDPLVSYCQVNTAATNIKGVKGATTAKEAEPEKVAATIVAYLIIPEEVAGE